MDKIINKVRTMTTAQILEGVKIIGGAFTVTTEQRMVRAALLEVYQERMGEDAIDSLMVELGMM